MKKKFFALSFFLCLTLACLLVGCSNEPPNEDNVTVPYVEGLEFTLKEDMTYDVTGIGGFRGTALKIPPTYKGLPVTSIGVSVPAQSPTYAGIQKLVLPSSVTDISKFNAPDLTEVSFEGDSRLEKIGYEAFSSCRKLASFDFPDGLKYIDDRAFLGCSLSDVSLPNNIEYVGEDAFNSDLYKQYNGGYYLGNKNKPYLVLCEIEGKDISSFSLPNETRVICDGVFEDCENLTGFSMSNNVVTIGFAAFSSCKNLTDITLSESLITIGDFAFYECEDLESIPLYDSLQAIGSNAFTFCSSLKSITVPESVKEIGSDAFRGCTALREAIFPNSLKIIPSSMFSDCTSLEKFTVPDGVITIGDFAFSNCSSLKEITLPSSVTFNGSNGSSFGYCKNLEKVYFKGTVDQWAAMEFYGTADNPLRLGADLYIDGALVENIEITEPARINAYAFYGCDQLKSVTVGGNVRDISRYAFYGCTGIVELKLLEGVSGVAEHAFEDCSALSNIDLPNSMRNLHRDAFNSCRSSTKGAFYIDNWLVLADRLSTEITLSDGTVGIADSAFENSIITTITIPSSVEVIGDAAFRSCLYLESVTFESSGKLSYLGENAFAGCESLEEIAIPSGVQELLYGTFAGCTRLSSIAFPASLKKIEGSAFSNCQGLESLIFPDSVEEVIGLPRGCGALTQIILPNSLISFTPDYDLTGNDALQYNEYDNGYYVGSLENPYMILVKAKNTDIISCEIHEKTQWIFYCAFENCNKLQELTVYDGAAEGIGDICLLLGDLTSLQYNEYDNGCYLGNRENPYVLLAKAKNTEIESCVIHENTSTIGSGAFWGCRKLAVIELPSHIEAVMHGAFNGCWSLRKVTISNSVRYIGSAAFDECYSLKSILIPQSVEILGEQTFYGSTAPMNIYCEKEARPDTYHSSSFSYWDAESWEGTLLIRQELQHNVYWYREASPTDIGNYWHYVDGVPTPW